MDFMDHRLKIKENKKGIKYLDLVRELKAMEQESEDDTNCNRCAWNDPQGLGKES